MDALSRKLSGFTFIEMIIVIVLIGILSLFLLPQLSNSVISLDAEATRLMNDIRYTQSLAMTKGQRYYLIKTAANAYQIRSAAGTPIVMATGGTTATFSTGTVFGAFTNLPNDLIAFDGQGIPYSTSTLPGTALAATGSMVLTNSGNSETVSITPQTGRVN